MRTSLARRRNVTPIEHDEQVMLIRWTRLATVAHPELDLLYAIPNGGERNKIIAAKLKAEGVRKGVPDLHLPVPRAGYCGLYVEMKRRKGGVVSEEQRVWIARLAEQGHRVEVCKGWEQARDVIVSYLAAA
ncbi:VRR-NUC domain-containing protein [Dyella sp. M7H15-1]|uniref:VRR-NUC domain-containing protein n=1 Tax=Dyella sp. M7H15-1 TaxID=2501295 RepID=UPI001004FB55|nr:VRR-NUC domain-containing protein [Dyella sp. M7H15-1]QAU22874.1 VRR-NUC domain-containing protein [Dyella sp. M7H15-1]